MCFFSPFSSFNDEKIKLQGSKWPNYARDSGNVQSHDKEESKSSSSAHTLTHDQIINKSIQ